MSLYASVVIDRQSQDITAEFSLQAGETATFLLGALCAEGEEPEMERVGQRFLNTAQFWKTWISKSHYKGRWREMVHRSALVLKLLISRKHGSLIAAPTFSLPEILAECEIGIIASPGCEMQRSRCMPSFAWVSSTKQKHSLSG